MTYEFIEKRNQNLLNLTKLGALIFSLIYVYYTRFFGIFLVTYLIFIYFMAKKDVEHQKKQVTIENKDIIFYHKISVFKAIAQMNYYNVIFISFLTLISLDFDAIPRDSFLIVASLMAVLVLMIYLSFAYRYVYSLIAFEEGFICKNKVFYFNKIKKYQAIKTKEDTYILEVSDGHNYISTRLNDQHMKTFNLLIEKSKDCH